VLPERPEDGPMPERALDMATRKALAAVFERFPASRRRAHSW
jgi:hypothetical protein